MDGDDSRKLMLIATGAGIFFFALWTSFLIFVALMAESRKNSDPITATLLLWPPAETIWSWVWLLRHAEDYSKSYRVGLGNTFFLAGLIAPPLLILAMTYSRTPGPDWLLMGAPMALTIVCCHAARWLWSRDKGETAERAAS